MLEGEEREAALRARYPGVQFGPNAQLLGLDSIDIGQGAVIAEDVWLNVCLRDGEPHMRIGRDCYVGRRCTLNTAGQLELGDYCLLGPNVYVGDADHTFTDITRPYAEQQVTAGRSVVVEENCWLGYGAVLNGELRLGRGSIVAAGAVLLADAPPFSVVAGQPARIVRLYNPLTRAWEHATQEAERERIMEARERQPLPGRAEYAELLRKNSAGKALDAVLTGGGRSL